ncbi:hypothetical protein GH714_010264 [Hevea brasiliensis]|uniref:Vegetative cell wall protein gp1-like n=1 Tax=Hevea brasiliensis TaxID=3981 RepID=A0A6A6MHW4_HEVBR|nr:hypothetical protein GH714_010264 [Hevea brasiliensis]
MANQPAQSRPWLFRLPSIVRPAPEPAPTPAPEPAPPQPRPPLARPAFRPAAPSLPPATQLQGPTPAPPPTTNGAGGGVASLPTSPVPRASAPSASLPTSPAQTTTMVAPVATSASVPSSPRPRVSAPTSSLPPSPASKPAPVDSLVSTPPAPKPAPSSSVPTSPAPKPVPSSPVPKSAPVTSSVPTSPAPKAMTTAIARVPSPEPSPRTIKPAVQSPLQSPKTKPTAPPPSPLNLPPAKIRADAETEAKIPLEAEQKTVLVQKTIDKPKPRGNGSDSERNLADALKTSIAQLGKQGPSKDGKTKENGQRKKISSDSEDGGMRVITIAGENKGAFMEVIRSPNKKHAFEGNPNYLNKKSNPNSDGNEWGSHSSSSSGEEGNPKKDKGHKGRSMASPPMSTFMNSNVQGVNNSIVFNSSCTHHDPGVHLAMSRKPAGGGFNIKDRGNGH